MKKFVVHPDYQHLSEAILDTLMHLEDRGVPLVEIGRNTIKKVDLGDVTINVKKFKIPILIQALIYQFFRKSKAQRSFEHSLKLNSMGIMTPAPVAYWEEYKFGLKRSFYVSVQLDYDFDFRTLNHKLDWPNRDGILRAFTKFTYLMHEKGVLFKDHSPGNTLIIEKPQGHYNFYLIDLNRMRFKPLSREERIKNFSRLWLSRHMIAVMAPVYAELTNDDPQKVEADMIRYGRKFRKYIIRKLRRRRKKQA